MTEKKPEKCSEHCGCKSQATSPKTNTVGAKNFIGSNKDFVSLNKDFVSIQNVEPNATPTSELSVAAAKELEVPDEQGVEKLFESTPAV
jgi:hypothetical protein